MKQTKEKIQKKEVEKFVLKPQKGDRVMVFMSGDYLEYISLITKVRNRNYKPARYGIVEDVVIEKSYGLCEFQEMINIKECPPVLTENVDFFFEHHRVNFI